MRELRGDERLKEVTSDFLVVEVELPPTRPIDVVVVPPRLGAELRHRLAALRVGVPVHVRAAHAGTPSPDAQNGLLGEIARRMGRPLHDRGCEQLAVIPLLRRRSVLDGSESTAATPLFLLNEGTNLGGVRLETP